MGTAEMSPSRKKTALEESKRMRKKSVEVGKETGKEKRAEEASLEEVSLLSLHMVSKT